MRSPLARVGALKLKLGLLLGGAVLATVLLVLIGTELGLPVAVTGLLSLVGGLVVVDLLGDGLTAPLREMAARAGQLAAGEEIDPVSTDARDEIGELTVAFNHMATEVAATDRLRREVVANASHELRTPLAALSAVLENLEDGVQSRVVAVPLLRAQTDRLTALVERLLDLSQLDAGATSLTLVPTSLVEVVGDVVGRLAPAARARVEVDVDPDLLVDLDATRFGQVVENLVGNALRHGPAGTPVHVGGAVRDDRVLLRVEDEGPGIAPADAERIFDRFVRADDGRTTATGGAGLGLAITRWVVELHGGDVRVDRPGQPGARLLVELPMSTSTPTPPPPAAPGGLAPPVPPGAGPPASAVGRAGPSGLPDGFAGPLSARQVGAVGVAAAAAFATPFVAPGIGFTLVLLVCGAAAMVAVERPPTPLVWTVLASGAVVAGWWTVSDAAWVLTPATMLVALLAGFAVWGPERAGEAFRAAIVGPLLSVCTPVPLVAGLRRMPVGRLRGVAVPAIATVAVVVVFGGLLASAEPRIADIASRVTAGLELDASLVGRTLLAGVAAVGVITYVLVDRVGAQPSAPWARPVRPRTDWLLPVAALNALLLLYIVLEVDLLLGVVDATRGAGVTLADAAREGFGQLVVVAGLVLAVVGVVARVAADADRRVRDLALGGLLGLTLVVLGSAALRLSGYVEAFGLTRLRVLAAWGLLLVALVLVLVVLAGTRPTSVPLTRQVLATVAVALAALVVVQPDALIAHVNVQRAERGYELDATYLTTLSADAVPGSVAAEGGCDAWQGGFSILELNGRSPASSNIARSRADAALATCGDPFSG